MNGRTTRFILCATVILQVGGVSGQTKKRTRLQQDDGYELTRQPEDLMFCVLGSILQNSIFGRKLFELIFVHKCYIIICHIIYALYINIILYIT
jgi:hypothetical protein